MSRHTTTIDPELDPGLLAAVREADDELRDVLGDAAPRVQADWGPGNLDASFRPTALLRLTDAGVSRLAELTDRQLEDRFFRRHGLRRLWQDVLAERIRVQQRRVIESLATAGEGA